MSLRSRHGKLPRAGLLNVLFFFISISAPAAVFLPSTKAPFINSRQLPQDTDLHHGRESSLTFLQMEEPVPPTAPGSQPVKAMLMHLAAINQKLADDSEAAASVQPQAVPGNFDAPEVAEEPPSSFSMRPRTSGSRANVAMISLSSTGLPRPQAGTPNADVVYFGLYGKTFYGVDLKAQEFTIDSVLTMTWMDPRTIAMVPVGQEDFTLSDAESTGKVWTPGVQITNGAGRRLDRLSSSLTIAKDGRVTQVERILVVVKNKFILNDFPFDKQTLRLNVASMYYVSNEVALTPFGGNAFSGLRKGFFDGEDYFMNAFVVKAYEDVAGPLQKSRGSMEISVTRSQARFQRNFLLPAFIYLTISCAVFWLPFSPTFVTPRVALSILILLIFSNLAAVADNELPGAAPYNWIDLMSFTIQLNMFTVVCLNIFTEIAYHSMRCTSTAVHISNELKVVAPVVGALSMFAILAASTNPDGPLGLQVMTKLTPIMFFLFLVSYMTCCGSTLMAERSKIRLAEQQKAEDFAPGVHGAHGHNMGGLGPLASSESLAPRQH